MNIAHAHGSFRPGHQNAELRGADAPRRGVLAVEVGSPFAQPEPNVALWRRQQPLALQGKLPVNACDETRQWYRAVKGDAAHGVVYHEVAGHLRARVMITAGRQ